MPMGQKRAVASALQQKRRDDAALWRARAADMAVTLQTSRFGERGIGGGGGLSELACIAIAKSERSAFLAQLPILDKADVLDSLTRLEDRDDLLGALDPIEQLEIGIQIGARHSDSLRAINSPTERAAFVATLPAAAVAAALSGIKEDVIEIFAAMGSKGRGKLMKRMVTEATIDAVAYILQRLPPKVAAALLEGLPSSVRAAVLLPLDRTDRDRILAHISGQRMECSRGLNTIRGSERSRTAKAITEAREQAALWGEADPLDIADDMLASPRPRILVAAIFSLMEARDVAVALDAFSFSADDKHLALYLAHLPEPFRKGVLERLGESLAQRFAQAALVSPSQRSIPARSPTILRANKVMARRLAPCSSFVVTAVLSSMEPMTARGVLAAMRPQRRSAATAALSSIAKARIVASLGTATAAAAFMASLRTQDRGAVLSLLGRDVRAAILLELRPEKSLSI